MGENRNSNLAFYVDFGCWASLFAACRFWRLLPPGLYTALTVCFALVVAVVVCVTLQNRLDRMLRRTHSELARRAADFSLRRNVEADLRRGFGPCPRWRT